MFAGVLAPSSFHQELSATGKPYRSPARAVNAKVTEKSIAPNARVRKQVEGN
jgi:hypothetical protein